MQSMSSPTPSCSDIQPVDQASTSRRSGEIVHQGNKTKKRGCKSRQTYQPADISRFMVSCMKTISRKTVVPLDPTIKRTLCKTCHTILVPGVTSHVRVKGSATHGHTVSTTCLHCKSARAIPCPPLPSKVEAPAPVGTETHEEVSPEGMAVDSQIRIEPPAPTAIKAPIAPARGRHKRHKKNAKLPPLALREDAGHLIFVGNKVINGPRTGS